MRKWLLVPIGLLAVFGIVLLVARAALTPERVRALVQPRLEAALGRPVQIGAIRIATFPLAVHVRDVAIAAPPGFPSPHLVQVASLDLEPRILPLLSKRIVIRRIRVRAPEVWVEQRADSVWNWATPPRAGSGRPAGSGSEPALGLTVESLAIEAGRIRLHAQPTAMRADVPLAAEIGLRADAALRDVRVSGWLAADSVRAQVATLGDVRLPPLRFEPDVSVDVPESTATVQRLRIRINRAAIDLAGTARMHGKEPEFHLATRGQAIDLAELLAALPPGAGGTAGLEAAGSVQFDLQADGVPGSAPVLRGRVQLANGSVRAPGLPEPVSHLGVDVVFAGDSLRIEQATARLGDAPVRAAGLVLDPWRPAHTRYDLGLEAALDLARLSRVAPLPPGVTLAGRADVNVRARGRTARPDSVWLSGPIVLRDVIVTTPALRLPLRADARLQGEGLRVRIESARLAAGESVIDVTGHLVPALPPRQPRVELAGRTSRLDLVALLPAAPPAAASATPTAADSAAARAGVPLVPVLPPVHAHVRLDAREVLLQGTSLHDATLDVTSDGQAASVEFGAKRLVAGETTLHDATGSLRAADHAARGHVRAARANLRKLEVTALESDVEIDGHMIRLPTMRARAYAGSLRGTTVLDLARPSQPKYDIDATAEDLQFGAFLGSFWPPLAGAITGSLDLNSKWEFAGPGPETIRQSLSGGGRGAATNGRIAELPVLDQLSGLLQLPSLKSIPYRDLGLQFDVAGGRVGMRDFALRGSDADMGIGGSIGLDGSLDLGVQVTLSQEATRRALGSRAGGTLTSLFTDGSGRLVFDVAVGGTHRAPKIRIDAQKTAARAGVASLTENALRSLLGGKLPALPALPAPPAAGGAAGTDTVPPTATAGDVRDRALDEAKKQLGGKLGELLGGGKRPAPADTTRRPR